MTKAYRVVCATAMIAGSIFLSAGASTAAGLDPGLDWPAFYDREVIHGLNIKIKDVDWDTIRADDTFDIEVPALFWTTAEGEAEAVLVSIRRKSATPIGSKVSFKVDINEYEDLDPRAMSKWHGLKKLSLENGDDLDVVTEGMAWYLHRLATSPISQVYPAGHLPGLANWATLTAHVVPACPGGVCQGAFDFDGAVTEEPQGVYVNLEQPDKQYLKNRGLWISDQTWLYKQDDIGLPELKEVGCEDVEPEGDSPAVVLLQCSPFKAVSGKGKKKVVPDDCTSGEMSTLIDMDVMLAQGAVEALSASRDGMFTHEKNYYWTDRSNEFCDEPLENTRRLHFPWDLDQALGPQDPGTLEDSVYGRVRRRRGQEVLVQTDHQRVILGVPEFRDLYNTMLDTLTGANFIGDAIAYLDLMEPHLTPLLEADPNSKMNGDVAGHFNTLRFWLLDRADIVRDQICADDASLC